VFATDEVKLAVVTVLISSVTEPPVGLKAVCETLLPVAVTAMLGSLP
jgi:hypothetical protein